VRLMVSGLSTRYTKHSVTNQLLPLQRSWKSQPAMVTSLMCTLSEDDATDVAQMCIYVHLIVSEYLVRNTSHESTWTTTYVQFSIQALVPLRSMIDLSTTFDDVFAMDLRIKILYD
jgi:hypothetical protein